MDVKGSGNGRKWKWKEVDVIAPIHLCVSLYQVSLYQVSQDSLMLSHHQCGPAEESALLNSRQNNLQANEHCQRYMCGQYRDAIVEA